MMKAGPWIVLLAIPMMVGMAMAQQAGTPPQQQAPLQQPRPAPTPEQQEQIKRQDAELTEAAQAVLQLVDTGNQGLTEVWSGLSQAIKPKLALDDFVGQISTDRIRLGAVQSRGQAVVSRSYFQTDGDVPKGFYVNVAFPTRFANAKEPVRELVSFRLDEDRVWRVSGYSVR